MSRPERPRSASQRLARWLLAVAIFGSTMAIGAVHTVVLLPITGVLLAAVVFAWWGGEPLRARRSATLVVWTGVGLALFTALTIVPLPAHLLALLSPHAADTWARALVALGKEGPSWAPLSLDPTATRIQLLRGVAYVLTFVAASRISARREGVTFLERALLVTAIALVLTAVIHPALGAEKVFGIYTPRRDPGLRHVAPILNSNTLAGYLTIGLSVCLGQLLTPREAWPRSLLAVLAVVLVGMEVWIASRGGLAATVLAVALVAWMSRARGHGQRGTVGPFIVPGVLILVGVGVAVLGSSELALGEVATLETGKLDLVRNAFRVVPDFPVFGAGRGAFESVFPAFRTDSSHLVYRFPENVVAQWMSEWGVPVTLAAFAALALALRPSTAMARSPRAAGPWVALVVVGAHNLVDFGSEYPAVIIALATCAGIVTGGTSGVDTARRADRWSRHPKALVAVAVLASLVAAVLVLPSVGREVMDDQAALHASALDPSVSRAEFERRAEAAMLRHPAEPYLPFTGALRAVRAGDASLLPWIERTVERALVYGPAHLLLARWLTPRSPSQARFEYRLTTEQAPELAQYVWPSLPALIHTYDDAVELLPRSPDTRGACTDYLARAVAPRLPATARRLDDLAREVDPNDRGFAERRAKEGLLDLLAGSSAPWCVGEGRKGCVAQALAASARLAEIAPTECVGHALHARVLLAGGDADKAVQELRGAADAVSDRTACLKELADVATLARSDETVSRALERVSHAGCAEAAECVQNLTFVAGVETARGNLRSALSALRRASALTPDDDSLLEQSARLATKLEMHVDALRAYEALALRHPGDGRWSVAAAAEKAALMSNAIPY